MPKRKDIKKILIIGSGPIVIGQNRDSDLANDFLEKQAAYLDRSSLPRQLISQSIDLYHDPIERIISPMAPGP